MKFFLSAFGDRQHGWFRLYTYFILIFPLAACGGEDPLMAAMEDKYGVVLPDEPLVADVMKLQMDPEAMEIVSRFNQAMEEDPAWWVKYSMEYDFTSNGLDAIPYHPKMGISEEEYEVVIAGFHELDIYKVGEFDLWFERVGPDTVRVQSRSLNQYLGAMTISFAGETVTTPNGKATGQIKIGLEDQEELDFASPVGEWQGWLWERKPSLLGILTQANIRVGLGRRTEDGRGVFFYRVLNGDSSKGPEDMEFFLVYGPKDEN